MKISVVLFGLLTSFVALAPAQTGYTVETFTVPGATDTGANGINDAGFTVDTSDILNADGSYSYSGFLRSPSGQLTTVVPPQALGPTFAYSLNNENVIVGNFDDTGAYHYVGFGFHNGLYTSYSTDLYAINDKFAVLGDTSNGPFIRTPKGTPHFIEYPGEPTTGAYGLNDAGDIVGFYVDFDFNLSHGFLLKDWTFQSLDYPGASQTSASGINNSDVVVGSYQPHAAYWRGFIWHNGIFQDFVVEGAKNTYLGGINNQGQLAGTYTDKNNRSVAFIASPKAN